MNNTKFLKIVIVLLLLINISTLSFMWLNLPVKHDFVGDVFAKELQFTEQQKEQFQTLKEEHRSQVEALKSENKEKHDAYLNLLKTPNVDSLALKKAVAEILKIKEKEELAMFYHFQKVRALCDETQKKKFDQVINEAARMMAPMPPREGQGPPPRGRFEDGPPPPRP
jgi:Spy/CpxP family protein refolding chaperone